MREKYKQKKRKGAGNKFECQGRGESGAGPVDRGGPGHRIGREGRSPVGKAGGGSGRSERPVEGRAGRPGPVAVAIGRPGRFGRPVG